MGRDGVLIARIRVSIARQELHWSQGQAQRSYVVSTAAAGVGERNGSLQTPRGWHRVRACIGDGAHPLAVFRGRRPTGELWSASLAARHPQRDWILARILWLCGTEPGVNRFGEVDSMGRYIYIHGTPPDQPLGVPASHGCVRMAVADVIDLYERTRPNTEVCIDD